MLTDPDKISGIEFLFSRRTATTLLDIIHTSLSCESEDDFIALFTQIQKLFPFDFAFSGLTNLNNDGGFGSHVLTNISYPDEWLKVYQERKFQNVDVVLKENFTTFRPQHWSDTYKKSPPPKYFISIAEDFGLRDGYTHGLRTLGSIKKASLFSFSGNLNKYDKRVMAILEHLVPHLHQAICRVHTREIPNTKRDPLSGREKEVLNWLKRGKSSWEISIILKISERTVNFHIYKLRQKLDAINRLHAVAAAVSLGLIELD